MLRNLRNSAPTPPPASKHMDLDGDKTIASVTYEM